ncbi:hypothetical protein ACFQX6_16530 [Streptosporangium lutulentum]
MANRFRGGGSYLYMSNGGTEVFVEVLTLAVSALASREWEFRFAALIAEQDQTAFGRGVVGFDLEDLDWGDAPAEHTTNKGFVVEVVDLALSRHRWDELGYDPPSSRTPCGGSARWSRRSTRPRPFRNHAGSRSRRRWSPSLAYATGSFPRCPITGGVSSAETTASPDRVLRLRTARAAVPGDPRGARFRGAAAETARRAVRAVSKPSSAAGADPAPGATFAQVTAVRPGASPR